MEENKGRSRRRNGKSEEASIPKVGAAVQDGRLLVEISEMMVWSKVSSGDYNKNQAYAHIVVAPSAPWVICVPIGDVDGPEAVTRAIAVLQDAVHEVVKQKASELETEDREAVKRATSEKLSKFTGVEVKTSVQSIEGRFPARPSIEAAVGEPPDDNEGDF